MALAAAQHIEIRTSGNNLWGGAFNPGNANFASLLSGLACDTDTPRVFTGDYTFTSGDIGYHLFVATTGANNQWLPGWYPIVNVTGTHAILSAPISGCVRYKPTTVPYSNYNTTVGIASVASPVSGKWGIDYSQGTGVRYAFTDMRINGSGASVLTFTSSGNPVGKNFIGNIINVYGSITGAWLVQRAEVSSTAGTVATCVASGAGLGVASQVSGTGGSGNMGGPIADLGTAGKFHVAGNKIFLKSTPGVSYGISSATNNTTGGGITLLAQSSNTDATKLLGYQNIRYDIPTVRPSIIISGVTATVPIRGAAGNIIEFIDIDCTGAANCGGIFAASARIEGCRVVRAASGGISGTNSKVAGCEVSGCGAFGILLAGYVEDCFVSRTNGTGIANCNTVISSIAAFNTGVGISFTLNQASNAYGCNSVGNTSHGFFRNTATAGQPGDEWVNNIAYGNGGTGFGLNGIYDQMSFANNAAGANANNTIGGNNAVTANIENFITLTQNPFTNTGIMDFSLNTSTGGGALLTNAAFTQVFPGIPSINYQDIGAIQSQDSGVASVTTGNILIQRRRRIV